MADLFRKEALERLSNPEQLDRAITVTPPVSWLALIGVAVGIGAVFLWAAVGTLPTTVSAKGVASAYGASASVADSSSRQVVCYVPYEQAFDIRPGMKAVVTRQGTIVGSSGENARASAVVDTVGATAASLTEMGALLGKDNLLVEYFTADGPVTEVRLTVTGGASWPPGALVEAQIVTEESAPISRVFVH
ncbi:MAG: hypothetical protein LBR77_09200 [Lachnospiraceae bacterium]|jgi:hypothetical protein|nr:hypothetical protein [Lachnospiraceae bacterium]